MDGSRSRTLAVARISAAGPLRDDATIEDGDGVRDAPRLLEVVRDHHDGRPAFAFQRQERFFEPARGRLVEAAGRLVEEQQLGFGIERVGKEHATDFAAGQDRERALFEAAQADPGEQLRNLQARGAGNAETDRSRLASQRQEVLDADRKRRIDRKVLRDIADASGARPVQENSPGERDEAEHR